MWEKRNCFSIPHQGGDKTVSKAAKDGLPGHDFRAEAVKDDKKPAIAPTRYSFRSFDRQWIIPDSRLINRPNPTLWKAYSPRQIYLTVPEDRTPTSGPALTVTGLIPDLHHYNGRGGRVYPLWIDRAANAAEYQTGAARTPRESFWEGGQGRGRDGLSRCRNGSSGVYHAV